MSATGHNTYCIIPTVQVASLRRLGYNFPELPVFLGIPLCLDDSQMRL
jgi:hypothetical protein